MRRILIVDDDPAILLVSSMALEQTARYEVVQARGGEEAVLRARELRPDVVLMDLVMHDLDGPEVLERLRADEATAGIPVIFHTAKTDPTDVRDLLALGAKGVITKPVNPMELASAIERILAG